MGMRNQDLKDVSGTYHVSQVQKFILFKRLFVFWDVMLYSLVGG
jgi:hypothetical protein